MKAALKLLLAAMTLAAGPVWANYYCNGTIDQVTVSPGTGVVYFSSASSGLTSVYLCLLEGTQPSANGNVTPEQCKAMLTVLLTAQATGHQVQFGFNDALTCTSHPSWAWLTGWYWGPVITSN